MNKEQAIQAAADHADRVHENWSQKAYQKCLLYLTFARMNNIKEFQICDLRQTINVFFLPIPEPPTKRSWGNIARLLVKNKKIEIVGYKPTNNLTAHNAIAAIYKPL